MATYVDDMRAPFGRMILCHMIADTHAELLAMARRIGVRRKWIQHEWQLRREHYDICLSMRAKAVKAGAVEITWRNYAERLDDPARTRSNYYGMTPFERMATFLRPEGSDG